MEKLSKWEMTETYKQDIGYDEAFAAYRGVSFSPEKRASRVLLEWPVEMVSIYQELKAVAAAGRTESILDVEFERFHAGYLERERVYLHSQSNCVSTMIAGASNFPAASQKKKGDRTHAKLTEALDFKKRVIEIIKRKLRPDLAPIRTEDGDAVDRLKEKIEAAEKAQERMKETNKIIKKYSDEETQVKEMTAIGFDEKTISEILHPRFAHLTPGFPAYAMTNNNANIRRMKQRVEDIQRKQNRPEEKQTGKNGVIYNPCPAENRVRLFFPGKPAADIISELKSNGFRWTPSLGCWQAYHNGLSISRARRFAGLE